MRAKPALYFIGAVLAVLPGSVNAITQVRSTSGVVDFAADVQPILTASCYQCHGSDLASGQLRLDVKSLALKGGISGPVILPGNSADSRLILRVKGTGSEAVMPLGKDALSPANIETLARWIDEGAVWPDSLANERNVAGPQHWAYQRPVKSAVPSVTNPAWVRNPIDSFVLSRLDKEGLKPSPEASRETLIRRLSLDLIGLPPTPAEVDAFLNDARPDAYERVVERLLASPHYGERWATPWLDLARYADSNGYEKDRRRSAWPYRDWVIDAFNRNLPFDQFATEQLAGDLLPNATRDQRIATGFLRNSMINEEGGVDPEESNWLEQLDRASTVGTVFLGSTLACAQCHNHKYDPFAQKDLYSMMAFFNNSAFLDGTGNRGGPTYREPTLDLPTADQAQKRDALNAQIQTLQKRISEWPNAQELQTAWERAVLDAENDWKPLVPTRLASSDGTTLTLGRDGSILASGLNPDNDTYTVEAKTPVAGQIMAIRIEALPHSSLPRGGPGRNFYGNFSLYGVDVNVGPSMDRLSKVAIQQTFTDAGDARVREDVAMIVQMWVIDATGDQERLRRQLLLIPEKPLTVADGDSFRIDLAHLSESSGQALGNFRLSVTTSPDPRRVIDIPDRLRPLLLIPKDERTAQQNQQLTNHYRTVSAEMASVRDEIAGLRRQIEELRIPDTLVVAEKTGVDRPSTELRIGGSYTRRGEVVVADVPSALGRLSADAPPNRLGLARWLVSRDNPVTARVRVNQIWQTYFGRGIVESSEDFGSQGIRPSHSDLLDWLAVEFMDKGWDQKAIHRLIVNSSTYRQSSAVRPDLLERDPSNTLLSRGARYRVEAEMVRDVLLSASGLLSSKMGGPSVMPYQPQGVWDIPSLAANDQWVLSLGEDRYRRSLYTMIRRTSPYPMFMVFDGVSREFAAVRRARSNTPLQSLTTLNDPEFFEAAQAMAQRILSEGGDALPARLMYGFRLVTSRRADALEMRSLTNAYEKELRFFQSNRAEAEALSGRPDPELAAMTMMSNMLLNLDETLTRE